MNGRRLWARVLLINAVVCLLVAVLAAVDGDHTRSIAYIALAGVFVLFADEDNEGNR